MSSIDNDEFNRRAKIVTDDCGGIMPHTEIFYTTSIIYSATRCLSSFKTYNENKNRNIKADELVSMIQEAVGHAAALSRYFWPVPNNSDKQEKKLSKKRGVKLRGMFILNKKSPLWNRDLRNAWEHFDERLDRYLIENSAGKFIPTSIIGSHKLADEEVSHIFKLLDIEEECLVLMGEKFFFGEIINEVKRIYDLALNRL
jgi:hypothetical protein